MIDIDGVPHVISFAYTEDRNKSYLIIINTNSEEVEEILIPCLINIGFHSTFIDM